MNKWIEIMGRGAISSIALTSTLDYTKSIGDKIMFGIFFIMLFMWVCNAYTSIKFAKKQKAEVKD